MSNYSSVYSIAMKKLIPNVTFTVKTPICSTRASPQLIRKIYMCGNKNSEMRIYFEKFISELLEHPELYKEEKANEGTVAVPMLQKPGDFYNLIEALYDVLRSVFPNKPQSIVCSSEGVTLYYIDQEKEECTEIMVQSEVLKEILEKRAKRIPTINEY